MIFIAIFIFGAAGQESKMTQVRHQLQGYTVQQAFTTTAYRLESHYTLQQAANMMAYTGQKDFAVVNGDRFVGFISSEVLQNAMRTHPSYAPISGIMTRNVHPVSPTMDLFTVQQRFIKEDANALPVISQTGRFLGIITRHHIANLYRMVQSKPPIITDPQSI